MSDTISDLPHEEQSALLLDYVKGRTSEEIGNQIESLAAKDSRLAEELAYYQGLAKAVHTNNEDQPVDEIAWARISRSIDEENTSVPQAANDNVRKWQYIAAALALLIVGQSGYFATQGPNSGDQYETVSESTNDIVIQVTFMPGITEEQLRQLLQQVEGEFIGGPGSLGVYEIGFQNEDARNAALDTLMNSPELVESAFAKTR